MAIPERVPISYEPDYRTDTIGTYDGGQFFGSVTATVEDGAGAEPDWFRFKRWYAVLHRFDHDGGHTDSQIWFAGTSEHERAAVERPVRHLNPTRHGGWSNRIETGASTSLIEPAEAAVG
ncbi:hypothetical protein I0C86_01595 [Plantactinospora sp. S1510]|uniref:Uncharacterized protein n=1 Tax=Plantactinospora alkalitolerans TaxID=2789879 RepID=A0ABS0GNC9_9ACTN|nr:hypothetical protein [Plantactinospora alkalitolerans]MBF9127695.1 hypothetical protein [Plantactinospora alkalitolerans]